MASSKKSSAVSIAEGIVILVLVILIAGMLFLYFSFRDTGAAPGIFGYTIYHTHASTMEPKIPAGSAVICKASENENIKVGSAVLCKIDENNAIMRVVQLVSENGEMSYVVKFDTAGDNDTYKLSSQNVIATAIWVSDVLGSLIDFATSTKGILIVIITPSFLIILFQIIRIVNVRRAEEDAYSLDDLEEIMLSRDEEQDTPSISGGDNSSDDSSSPDLMLSEGGLVTRRIVKEDDLASDGGEGRQVLSIDKNGKAELKPASDEDDGPLYSYDHARDRAREPQQGGGLMRLDDLTDSADDAADDNDNGGFKLSGEDEGEDTQRVPDFMSDVLPEKLAGAVAEAESPEQPNDAQQPKKAVATPVKVYEKASAVVPPAAPSQEEKTIRSVPRSIPAKAVVPREKLAPPPKKSSGKTISELMSIIDAEESKLNKGDQ